MFEKLNGGITYGRNQKTARHKSYCRNTSKRIAGKSTRHINICPNVSIEVIKKSWATGSFLNCLCTGMLSFPKLPCLCRLIVHM